MHKLQAQTKSAVLVIVGPTASGKSSLAVELAKKFGGEVVSADSRQVYIGLDIGTGKITKREMRGVLHHLLDVASPKRAFTAHEYLQYSNRAIKRIAAKKKLPIVAGGTGFYIDALLGRLSLPNVPPNKALRARLSKKSAKQLYALLKKRDPHRAKAMSTPSERNNKVRLIRAIEVASSKHGSKNPEVEPPYKEPPYKVLWIGIAPNQKALEQKIAERLKARIRQGMITEGKRLHAKGLSYKRMESLGLEYRALAQLLQNKITRKEFEEELLRDIRRYAKKQLVYWKRNSDIRWYQPTQKKAIERAVAACLKIS